MTHVLPYRRRKITYQSKGKKQEKAPPIFKKELSYFFLLQYPDFYPVCEIQPFYNIKLEFNIMSEPALAME